jgi:hypothetical protein
MDTEDRSITTRVVASLFPKGDDGKAKPALKPSEKKSDIVSSFSSKNSDTVVLETVNEEDDLPKIRVRAEEKGEKVKKFATAKGASMHLTAVKAKRAGLSALHKAVGWLAANKKK